MKFKTAFHLLVAATIAFGVTSCGSDKNEANSGSTTVVNTPSVVTSGTGNGARTASEFYTEVSNYMFEQSSEPGLYSFPRNVTSGGGFDFDFCWGYEDCMQDQIDRSQSQVNNYYWRFLDSDGQTVYRNFTSNGITYAAPDSDDQFGNTLSSLRDGLLRIISNASRAEKSNGYSFVSVSTSSSSGTSNIDLNCYYYPQACNNNTYSKHFRFRYNNYWYEIDLTKSLINNPVRVYR
ncbi:hypothetical protein BIY24_14375 [Halobacteriovorax marinus]|uniref:hypothetical protein n=1 Tax=Halobacteriovorax marinus TaxID=97084 RepID=UPI000BC340B5|nr:hypothetical protein [Halobacteriovorax marinus]ATH09086.1 hypothetical protein BIY24_14375 [Halobacteriovorax marinus]